MNQMLENFDLQETFLKKKLSKLAPAAHNAKQRDALHKVSRWVEIAQKAVVKYHVRKEMS